MERVGLPLLLLAMGVMAVQSCGIDADCSTQQFCYKVSQSCVDYILCNRYKRQEGKNRARDPVECGSCLPGYYDEVLSSGQKTPFCKFADKAQEDTNTPFGTTLFWIIVLIALAVIIVTLTFVWIKKSSNSQNIACSTWQGFRSHCHNAPIMEAGPFIKIEEPPLYSPVYDANSNINVTISKEKARLATATPFQEPNWVQSNQLYNDQLSDEEDSLDEQASAVVPLPPEEDTNPSSWVPEQVSLPIEDRPFRQFAIEQRENTASSALVCANTPLASSSSTNNDDEPTPESGSTYQDESHRRRMPTIAILQKIEFNLSVPKGDY